MSSRRDGRFSGLSEAIDRYLKGHHLQRASRDSQVPLLWAEVVGEWYARHSQVLRAEQGIVTVRCDSAARAQQLQLDAPKIIEALNERLGSKAVKEIRASSGGIRRRDDLSALMQTREPEGPPRGEWERIDLPAADLDWIRSAADDISDGNLRRVAESLLVKMAKRESWKRAHGYRPCVSCGALVLPPRRMCKSCDPGRIPQQGSTDVLEEPWSDKPWQRRQ